MPSACFGKWILYSASSHRSASRPSRLSDSTISRRGLFLMQLTMIENSIEQARLPSSSGGRSVGKYGCVLRNTSSTTFGSTAVMCATKWESPLVVPSFLVPVKARKTVQVSKIQGQHRHSSGTSPRCDTSVRRFCQKMITLCLCAVRSNSCQATLKMTSHHKSLHHKVRKRHRREDTTSGKQHQHAPSK